MPRCRTNSLRCCQGGPVNTRSRCCCCAAQKCSVRYCCATVTCGGRGLSCRRCPLGRGLCRPARPLRPWHGRHRRPPVIGSASWRAGHSPSTHGLAPAGRWPSAGGRTTQRRGRSRGAPPHARARAVCPAARRASLRRGCCPCCLAAAPKGHLTCCKESMAGGLMLLGPAREGPANPATQIWLQEPSSHRPAATGTFKHQILPGSACCVAHARRAKLFSAVPAIQRQPRRYLRQNVNTHDVFGVYRPWKLGPDHCKYRACPRL